MNITRITSVMAATATAGIVCAPIVSADASHGNNSPDGAQQNVRIAC